MGSLFPSSLTADEVYTLEFCRQWLSGQDSFVVKTSGSTGEPKPITLRREQLCKSARLTGRYLGLQRGDKALVCLSTQHIAGMMMLVRGFELSLSLTIVDVTGNPLAAFPEDAEFQFTALVPLQMQGILAASPPKLAILERMKAILIGGAPVLDDLAEAFKALSAPVYHTYGMTETASHIALRRLNGDRASDYFTPLAGVELGLDEDGCLTIRSAVTGFETLHTRDRVELQPDGSFRWLGRIDNVINSGGVKIQIERVEAILSRSFQIVQAGVLAGRRFFVGPMPDPRLGQRVAIIMEGEPLSQEMEAAVRRELLATSSLRQYEIPRYFGFVHQFLETPTGKVDRRANLRMLTKRDSSGNID
ncbi:MAG: AMP-binding protein [Gammaproteobacteria bacterium]|nr:AMP-binding protein [Gammaproteobacteria bacterium]MCP5424433.1 AMP-binding protein [Gammaproteobacteria bacterium]MCP5458427.1 AMP-binding protein [Gammaproteobacteria bacterium]